MMENVDLGSTSTPKVSMQVTDEDARLAEAMLQALMGDDENFTQLTDGELFGFSLALVAMRRGHMIARASWQIPGKYVILQPGEEMLDPETGAPARLKEHLVWKNAEGAFVPWTPSQDAILARDWFIGKSGDYKRRPPRTAEPIQN